MDGTDLKRAIEALLFSSEKPLSAEEVREAFAGQMELKEIREALEQLRQEYDNDRRGFRMYEIAGGYQLASAMEYAEILKRFYQEREKKKMSPASLETLSVIAYRQPVTRADIENIRGVNVDAAVKGLMEKGLIKITGRREVPGRPILYGTTREFLDHFGLRSLEDLPPLSEYSLKDLDPELLPPELKTEGASVVASSDAADEPSQEGSEQEGDGQENV
jgi:segregation and condensation protein B